uniref:Ovule protein n=1 Tax=Toxocara canis TaxID=6265 RepID=A0A183U4N4_TOXCA
LVEGRPARVIGFWNTSDILRVGFRQMSCISSPSVASWRMRVYSHSSAVKFNSWRGFFISPKGRLALCI